MTTRDDHRPARTATARSVSRARAALPALLLCLTTLATGCSMNDTDDLDYTPATLDVDAAKTRTKQVSSEVFDMIGLPGATTTPTGPSASVCAQDPEHLYATRHPWSVYGVSDEELKQGFERLRHALPAQGWKVVSYGPNKSKARNLELTADSGKDRFAVNAELSVGGTDPGKKHLIVVNVVSGCFRAPEGTDLDTLF
ncbi:hypothetical protein [Streptomyces sp. NBC_01216]|uniref:hypothetical protein n=1 Tax=unclassified Streptomyces TaxID=2593676 RepID=UPI002E0D67F1|nr:hypothetical protein OG393_16085 [Streptomyces sp. NBC_01216]